MTAFVIENVSVPPEVEAAIDKRSSRGAVGNLNDYVKFQMAEGMAKGQGGTGGSAAEMAMGFAMANQMIQQPGGMLGAQSTPAVPGGNAVAAAAPAPAALQLLSPTQAGELLGVSEADVTAALEAGDLKGKKIGTTWRVTRSAIDEFLKA